MPPLVSVIAGSKNDEEFLEPAFSILRDFSIPFEFKVLSAHRNRASQVGADKSHNMRSRFPFRS